MLKWLSPLRGPDPAHITDDPLAALEVTPRNRGRNNIYAVSRLNPLFLNDDHTTPCKEPKHYSKHDGSATNSRRESESPPSAGKSSGYASQPRSRSDSSSHSEEPIYVDKLTPKSDDLRTFRKSPDRNKNHPSPSSSSSSTGLHLTTIPEGKVDSIPRPVWPNTPKHDLDDSSQQIYASLTNYITQLNTAHGNRKKRQDSQRRRACAEDLLRELSRTIEAVADGKIQLTPEELLQGFNTKISQTLNVLQLNTENEIRNLSNQLSCNDKLQTVTRALSNSSRNSDEDEWPPRPQAEYFELPSATSSSGYSDITPKRTITKPTDSIQFVHRDLGSVPNGVRNAMIYGTLCRTPVAAQTGLNVRFGGRNVSDLRKGDVSAMKNKLHNDKPSVWENYYGAGITTGEFKLYPRPTDTPTFPAGRPEADFTLDVPRAEFLMRRMKADKRWRCKCRIITSLLGLFFFVFTVMAVSLMLTNGKKMFGSMF